MDRLNNGLTYVPLIWLISFLSNIPNPTHLIDPFIYVIATSSKQKRECISYRGFHIGRWFIIRTRKHGDNTQDYAFYLQIQYFQPFRKGLDVTTKKTTVKCNRVE